MLKRGLFVLALAGIALMPAAASAQVLPDAVGTILGTLGNLAGPGVWNNYNAGGNVQVSAVVGNVNGSDVQLTNGRNAFLHDGTIINPTGTTLQNGMQIAIVGNWTGNGNINANSITVIGNGYGAPYGGSYNNGYYPNAGYYNGGGYNGGYYPSGYNNGYYPNGGYYNGGGYAYPQTVYVYPYTQSYQPTWYQEHQAWLAAHPNWAEQHERWLQNHDGDGDGWRDWASQHPNWHEQHPVGPPASSSYVQQRRYAPPVSSYAQHDYASEHYAGAEQHNYTHGDATARSWHQQSAARTQDTRHSDSHRDNRNSDR